MTIYVTVPSTTGLTASAIMASARRIVAALSNTYTTQASVDLAHREIAKLKENLRELEEAMEP